MNSKCRESSSHDIQVINNSHIAFANKYSLSTEFTEGDF